MHQKNALLVGLLVIAVAIGFLGGLVYARYAAPVVTIGAVQSEPNPSATTLPVAYTPTMPRVTPQVNVDLTVDKTAKGVEKYHCEGWLSAKPLK